jgi:hypothetical protein
VAAETHSLSAQQLIGALQYSIQRLGGLTPTIGGRISFVLVDDLPHAWLLDLDRPGGAWLEGQERVAAALADGQLATAICAKTDAFRSLMFGSTSFDAKDVAVLGDRSKLTRLGELLGKNGSMVDQLVSAAAMTKPKNRKHSKKNRGRR